jgi:hypothetical protein
MEGERSNSMNREIQRHSQMIESSGMGFLPGIALAFGLSLLVMAALLIETWWAMAAVLGSLFVITGAVVWVIVKVIGTDEAGGKEG